MINITGTHVHYFHVCLRKLWLFAKGIHMEHTSETVQAGKLLGETAYSRRPDKYTELAIGGIKVDFFDAKNRVLHEVKKTNKMSEAHIAQVKYYLYVLAQHGLDNATGVLEYPLLKQKQQVVLTKEDIPTIEKWLGAIRLLTNGDTCPDKIAQSFCQKCAYYEFCWAN